MVARADVLRVLEGIPDPEMPISIVDLGIVNDVRVDGDVVMIEILPTFVGCPALEMIANDVIAKVGELPGVSRTDVRFVHDPPWSVDRITDEGRASLAAHGVTVPDSGGELPVPGHHGGGCLMIAGHHEQFDVLPVQSVDGFRCRVLDRVGHGQHAPTNHQSSIDCRVELGSSS